MILYEATSTYHLLCVLVDQISRGCPDSVLLASGGLADKFPTLEEALRPYFTDIRFYDIHYAVRNGTEAVLRYFENLTGLRPPAPDSGPAPDGEPDSPSGTGDAASLPYEEIYCSCEHYSFGYFLAVAGIPHICCEDGAGLLSRPQILIDLNDKVPARKDFNRECLRLGLYDASNPHVIRRRCNVRAQLPGFTAENLEHFDVVEKLSALDPEVRSGIIAFFAKDLSLDVREDAVLLLTQHYANLQTLSFEQQILIYQLLVDYFFSGQPLVIKPHPDDLMYYTELFPEAEVIRERFPSEFMPFVFRHQPACVATISSTAIFNLRGHYPRVFELDTRFERDYPMIHRYYAAVVCAARNGLAVRCLGADGALVARLCETLGEAAPAVRTEEEPPSGREALLIDDVTEQGGEGRRAVREALAALSPDHCAILLNSREDYCWYDYDHRELWDHMAPLVLQKTVREPASEDFYAGPGEDVVYLYSLDKELLTMLKETTVEKELPHAGLDVRTEALTPEQERIRMLEGILAATEKRLLYYIQKEREAR